MRPRRPELEYVLMHTVEFSASYFRHRVIKAGGFTPDDLLARRRVALECALAHYPTLKKVGYL